MPTLLGRPGSAVIHDIKGENWQLTAGWRSRFSHCLLFNPTDPRSARYNPLLEARRGDQEIHDAQNIADILITSEGALERCHHWDKTNHSLLPSDPQRSFVAVLRRIMATNKLGAPEHAQVHSIVASAAREALNKSENERSGVLSTAMSFLALYRGPTVAAVDLALGLADRRSGRGQAAGIALPRGSIIGHQPHEAGWCSIRSAVA